ncbi:hypothetical protein Emag_004339 [Eimeria magna]
MVLAGVARSLEAQASLCLPLLQQQQQQQQQQQLQQLQQQQVSLAASVCVFRSYLASAFDLPFEEEVMGIESLLELDPYSNSAFSYFFCLLQRAAINAQPQDVLGIWLSPVKRYIPVFEEQPTNESLVRFILGCVKKAAAAAQQQQQQQQQQEQQQEELQEVLTLLLAAAARVTAAGEGGERFGLEVGIVVDAIRHDYKAAAASLCCTSSSSTSRVKS